jgi:hypothetical protein
MIRRVFLDVDDTLNSFTLNVLRQFGCQIGDFDYHLFPDVGYDILTAYHLLKPADAPELSKTQFWNKIKRETWATCPKSPQFGLILGFAEQLVGQENVCILTAPTIDPDSLAGKLEWIQATLPRWLHRQFLVGPPKHFCARPDSLLIDDNDDKVDRFRECGGQAFLVPRPWNSARDIDTTEALLEFFSLETADVE